MKNDKLVSVIIPTYNMSQYVPLAIRSVLEQTYQDLEVIVIDDGSTDDTQEAIQEFSSDSRFRYESQENGGPAKARNKGIRLARGQWIAFNDADDVWYPQKLQKQVALFGSRPDLGVVVSDCDRIDERGKKIPAPKKYRYQGSRLYEQLLLENFIPMCTTVVTRTCFEQLGGFDETLRRAEDYDFWLRLSVSNTIGYVDEPLAAHRKWTSQLTSNKIAQAEAAILVQQRFLAKHPGLVSPRQAKAAWARKHAKRGRALAHVGRPREAYREFLRAIWLCPTYLPAMKSLIELALRKS